MISAVVLAAAPLEPAGEPALLQPLHGKPMLQWLLESAINSNLAEVICVVRDLTKFRPHIALTHEKLFWLVDYGADRSKAHALIAGLWSVDPRSAGVMFVRADQPWVSAPLIDKLIETFTGSNDWIVTPSFTDAGEPGSPMLFHRELFPELVKLSGDQDERFLREKYRANTELVPWQETRSLITPKKPAAIESPKQFN